MMPEFTSQNRAANIIRSVSRPASRYRKAAALSRFGREVWRKSCDRVPPKPKWTVACAEIVGERVVVRSPTVLDWWQWPPKRSSSTGRELPAACDVKHFQCAHRRRAAGFDAQLVE